MTTTITRTDCAEVDLIVRWQDVKTGDLVLLEDGFVIAALVEVIQRPWGNGTTFPSVDIRHQLDNGHFVVSERHGDRYTAVRRYAETEPASLRQQVQQARDDYDEQAADHGDLTGHEAQQERAYGRVEMCDEVLGWLAGTPAAGEGERDA